MSRRTVLLPLLLAALACKASPAPPVWVISPDRAGPVRFGTTPQEAAVALGEVLRDSFPAEGCDMWSPTGAPPGVTLMVENRRVVRADIDSQGPSTAELLRVGSSVTDVQAAFGTRLVSEPHKHEWDAGWRYLSLFTDDSSRGLVFEVDSFRVRTFRAGLWPQVGYVEHCS